MFLLHLFGLSLLLGRVASQGGCSLVDENGTGTLCNAGATCVDSGGFWGTRCAPCYNGDWCPEGTENPYAASVANLCPAGYFCNTSDIANPFICPEGKFCPPGTFVPFNCTLLGTYCAEGSSTPVVLCPGGNYCPTPAIMFECPSGHFCRAGSVDPASCSFLSACLSGTEIPGFSPFGLIGIFVVLGMIGLLFFFFHFHSKRLSAQKSSMMEKNLQNSEMLASMMRSFTGINLEVVNFTGFKRKSDPVSIRFTDLSLRLPNGAYVLSGVTGFFDKSRLIAVMGPSGSGKSTFLNVLTGKAASYGKVGGEIAVNGEIGALPKFKKVTGFVPQDDVVHPDLTVRENLFFQAMLRLPQDMPLSRKEAMVDDCIRLLGLHPVQHSLVGDVEKRGISGGQRKRVNIGIEVVASPSLLFLDEPTSGLDSTASVELINLLQSLTGLGITTVAVIHQPRYSIFTSFDEVLLLGKGGKTVYFGPGVEAVTYFEKLGFTLPKGENAADFLLDVISGQVPLPGNPSFEASDLFQMWEQKQGRTHSEKKEDPKKGAKATKSEPKVTKQHTAAPSNSKKPMKKRLNRRTTKRKALRPRDQSAMSQAFSRWDRDGDGFITTDELWHLMKTTGTEISNEEAQELISHFDSDGDGKISQSEFLGHTKSLKKETSKTSTKKGPSTGTMMVLVGESPEIIQQTEDLDFPPFFCCDSIWRITPLNMKRLWKIKIWGGLKRKIFSPLGKLLQRITENPPAWCTTCFGLRKRAGNTDEEEPKRITPGFYPQFMLFTHRAFIQFIRNFNWLLFDLFLTVSMALILGLLAEPNKIEKPGYEGQKMMLVVAVLASISGLQDFGNERVIFWREMTAGVNTLSYFVAKTVVSLIGICIRPVVFLGIIYGTSYPLIPFGEFYWVLLFVCWVTCAFGNLFTLIVNPQSARLAAVIIPTIIAALFHGLGPVYSEMGWLMKFLCWCTFAFWSTEAIVAREYHALPEYLQPVALEVIDTLGYSVNRYFLSLLMLLLFGIILRTIAYCFMWLTARKKK